MNTEGEWAHGTDCVNNFAINLRSEESLTVCEEEEESHDEKECQGLPKLSKHWHSD